MNVEAKLISCDLHDYVEIACLYRFEVNLHLADKTSISGKAWTTITQADKTEAIQLRQGSESIDVPLLDLARMEVLTINSHFSSVDFV